MALATFITITILLFWFFVLIRKRLSLIQNSILFMAMGIITRNYLTIMILQLGKIKISENHTLFASLLIYRDLIIPLVTLIFMNIQLGTSGWERKLLQFIWAALFIVSMDFLLVYFKVIQFTGWNLVYEGIVDIAYLLISLVVVKILMYLHRWESRRK